MTNLECVIAGLAKHREARRWTDEAVAADMLAEPGLNPTVNPSDTPATPTNVPQT